MSNVSNPKAIAQALASLGHEARLSVYRLLVRAGDSGLSVGQLVEELYQRPPRLTRMPVALARLCYWIPFALEV